MFKIIKAGIDNIRANTGNFRKILTDYFQNTLNFTQPPTNSKTVRKTLIIYFLSSIMDEQYPEVAVGALVLNSSSKAFLMRSQKWSGKYIIPGGHIVFGETREQGLYREVKEETQMDIYDINFVGVQEIISDPDFYRKAHFIFLDYTCKTNTLREQIKLNSEGSEFLLIYPKEALELPLAQPTRRTIERYLTKKSDIT